MKTKASLLAFMILCLVGGRATAEDRPNLIWIMADDLGFGEVGCYGQKMIATPNLDRMAREGLRFTHFYAGATVCAPSRSVLMTGKHHGHTRVRGNAGPKNPAAQALRDGDTTVADVLRKAGYRTALIGKWGLGDVGEAESGLPRKHGFDEFFGYLSQHRAHNHFPEYLWRNEEKVALRNKVTPVGDERRRLRDRGGRVRRRPVRRRRARSSSPRTSRDRSSSTGAWSSPTPTTSGRGR